MSTNIDIPLFYNPIDSGGLQSVLEHYADEQHTHLVDDFEKKIAGITKSRYVVALNSGTASLHLGLKALGVVADDEVFVSTFTYVASVNPILYLGAKPVFIDSETITGNMDPVCLEIAINDSLKRGKKPKVIIVVHSYGMPAQMKEILTLAQHHEIPVLEDAAEALGSFYNGTHLGTLGTAGILSFNNNKIITTYGGGAFLTNDKSLYEKVLHWASQAREDKPYYEYKEVGFNYRMGSLNAAAGLTALKSYSQRIEASRTKYALYMQNLNDLPDLTFTKEPVAYFSNRWLSTVLIDSSKNKSNFSLAALLKEKGIETRPLWNPMHNQPVFKDFPFFNNCISEQLFKRGLCLPSGYNLSLTDQIKVIKLIQNYFEK